MGNFFVDGLRYSPTTFGTELFDCATNFVGKSSVMPSVFSIDNLFPALSSSAKYHPFTNPNVGAMSMPSATSEIIDYFPSLSKASSPTVSTAASYSAPVSASSSPENVDFFASLLPRATQAVSSAIQGVANAGRSVVSSVLGFVSNLFGKLVNFAKSFVGRVNSDREGNRLFSGGRNQAWCADFVTYCVRKIFGGKLPSDFGSSAVSDLRAWGYKHGCYLKAPYEKGKAAMANFLKNKVKPGDIMIEKRNGKSHTGIVTYVDPNGQYFKTVEGNASDSVKKVTYKADSKTLSGFVSLSKFA